MTIAKVVWGARQSGKTTAAMKFMEQWKAEHPEGKVRYAGFAHKKVQQKLNPVHPFWLYSWHPSHFHWHEEAKLWVLDDINHVPYVRGILAAAEQHDITVFATFTPPAHFVWPDSLEYKLARLQCAEWHGWAGEGSTEHWKDQLKPLMYRTQIQGKLLVRKR